MQHPANIRYESGPHPSLFAFPSHQGKLSPWATGILGVCAAFFLSIWLSGRAKIPKTVSGYLLALTHLHRISTGPDQNPCRSCKPLLRTHLVAMWVLMRHYKISLLSHFKCMFQPLRGVQKLGLVFQHCGWNDRNRSGFVHSRLIS